MDVAQIGWTTYICVFVLFAFFCILFPHLFYCSTILFLTIPDVILGSILGATLGAILGSIFGTLVNMHHGVKFCAYSCVQFVNSKTLNFDVILGTNGLLCCSVPHPYPTTMLALSSTHYDLPHFECKFLSLTEFLMPSSKWTFKNG